MSKELLLFGAGAVIALISLFPSEMWARISLALTAFICLSISFWLHSESASWPRYPVVLFCGVIASILSWMVIHDIPTGIAAPDISLRFIYPRSPALVLINKSNAIAKNIKQTFALWNMDMPERNDPLPIPISTFDWIRPHEESGPQGIFDTPLVAPLLKPGSRLFGSVSVNCPECTRGRTYIVYIVWGEGGRFSEFESEKSGNLIVPPNFLQPTRMEYFNSIVAKIPAQSRKPIL